MVMALFAGESASVSVDFGLGFNAEHNILFGLGCTNDM